MLKKISDNSFEFVGARPVPLMRRTTEHFWHCVSPGEEIQLVESNGMPVQYSDGLDSWYPATSPNLFPAQPVVKINPSKEAAV